ncbi:hypothetical protein AA0481_1295 [Acetobacter orientalis NRIC 0481]|nr:hypothetical protein AA0481_1295 [Acetobacter orientalis NRIC 0481]
MQSITGAERKPIFKCGHVGKAPCVKMPIKTVSIINPISRTAALSANPTGPGVAMVLGMTG